MLAQPFCVLVNSSVSPRHFGCSNLKVRIFQKFPSHGKFFPERQTARRKIRIFYLFLKCIYFKERVTERAHEWR